MTQSELVYGLASAEIPHTPIMEIDGVALLLFKLHDMLLEIEMRNDQVWHIHSFSHNRIWQSAEAVQIVQACIASYKCDMIK